jgi:hypothetical protein
VALFGFVATEHKRGVVLELQHLHPDQHSPPPPRARAHNNHPQCPLQRCWFPNGNRCTNTCPVSVCGSRCAARPILDGSDLDFYANCSLVLGGLSLMNLPTSLGPDELMGLQTIRKIAGPLVVADNAYLTSLAFLSSLETAESVRITNNANLVDARLPALSLATTAAVAVDLNPRLCPARSLPSATSRDQGECAGTDLVLRVDCTANDVAHCIVGLARAIGTSPAKV